MKTALRTLPRRPWSYPPSAASGSDTPNQPGAANGSLRRATRVLMLAPVAGLAIALTGCAGLDVQSVTNETEALGYRYYESSAYLLVQTDNAGGLTSTIVHLPDETKKRSARPYSYLATNSVTLSFTNGVLTNGVVDVDETAIPTALISALEKAAGALIAAANTGKTAEQTVPAPYLFKIIFRDGSVTLVGDQPADKTISFGGAQ